MLHTTIVSRYGHPAYTAPLLSVMVARMRVNYERPERGMELQRHIVSVCEKGPTQYLEGLESGRVVILHRRRHGKAADERGGGSRADAKHDGEVFDAG